MDLDRLVHLLLGKDPDPHVHFQVMATGRLDRAQVDSALFVDPDVDVDRRPGGQRVAAQAFDLAGVVDPVVFRQVAPGDLTGLLPDLDRDPSLVVENGLRDKGVRRAGQLGLRVDNVLDVRRGLGVVLPLWLAGVDAA